MTFESYQNKRHQVKKHLKCLGGFFALYCISLLVYKFSVVNLLVLILAGIIICFIPMLLLYYAFKEKKSKNHDLDIENQTPIYGYKCKRFRGNLINNYEMVMIPYMVLAWIFLFESNFSGVFLIIHFMVMMISAAILFYLLRKYNEYALIFYDKGLVLNQKAYDYDHIRKHQWIKMRSGLVILEIQVKDIFTSLTFDKCTARQIQNHLQT